MWHGLEHVLQTTDNAGFISHCTGSKWRWIVRTVVNNEATAQLAQSQEDKTQIWHSVTDNMQFEYLWRNKNDEVEIHEKEWCTWVNLCWQSGQMWSSNLPRRLKQHMKYYWCYSVTDNCCMHIVYCFMYSALCSFPFQTLQKIYPVADWNFDFLSNQGIHKCDEFSQSDKTANIQYFIIVISIQMIDNNNFLFLQ